MPKNLQMMGLLFLLVLIWGVGWPIISVGLASCPPIWFAALRLCFATGLLFIAMLCIRQLKMPDKRDLPLIFSIGFFQIGLFVMLITLGLQFVPPGRSSIIAYISPFFVTPIAVLFFGEKITAGKIMGLLLGVVGIVLLFSPWAFDWHDPHVLLGNGLLVLAAVIWSGVMLHTRYATWYRQPHLLLPWQLLLATVPNLAMALYLAPHPLIHWQPSFLFSLTYMAVLATPVAYWIVIVISRSLPAVTTSLALLAVPVVGLLASAWIVGETLSKTIITALALIVTGLVFVSLSGR